MTLSPATTSTAAPVATKDNLNTFGFICILKLKSELINILKTLSDRCAYFRKCGTACHKLHDTSINQQEYFQNRCIKVMLSFGTLLRGG